MVLPSGRVYRTAVGSARPETEIQESATQKHQLTLAERMRSLKEKRKEKAVFQCVGTLNFSSTKIGFMLNHPHFIKSSLWPRDTSVVR